MSHVLRVLDHGFVALRNIAGPTRRTHTIGFDRFDGSGVETTLAREFDADDRDPAQAARLSFNQMDSERTLEEDMKLSRYLLKNLHTSPFEQVQVWFDVKLPIFLARQFVRHRTVRLNEISGRYVQLPPEWYVPALEDIVIQSKDKKQGGKPIDLMDNDQREKAIWYKLRLEAGCKQGYEDYQQAIENGIAMEQARLNLHLNHYTHWLWNQDLHNLMHFLRLRDHGHAQLEAQRYAQAKIELLELVLPETMKLWNELRHA